MSGLSYAIQKVIDLVAGGSTQAVTSAYADGFERIIPVGGFSKADISINYTQGASETGNSIQLQIQQSPDNGETWYDLPLETTTSGTSELTVREWSFTGSDTGAATISLLLDIAYKQIKIKIKETGVVTNAGNVSGHVTLSGM